jgi:hypothetical protein
LHKKINGHSGGRHEVAKREKIFRRKEMSSYLGKCKCIMGIGVATLMLLTAGCTANSEAVEGQTTSPDHVTEAVERENGMKPYLELANSVKLSNVEEDLIPDVTAEKWSLGLASSKPIVDPNGEYVIAIEHEKMARYDIKASEKVWEVPVYGGIYNYG